MNNQEIDLDALVDAAEENEPSEVKPSLTIETGDDEKTKEEGDDSETEPEDVEQTKEDDADKAEKEAAAKKEAKPDADKGKEPAKKGESAYKKAQGDRERFRANWGEMERKNAEVKAGQEELAKQRQQLEQQRQEFEAARVEAAKKTTKQAEYTPEELEAFAKEFDEDGQPQLAAAARAKAKQQREAAAAEQQHQTKEQQARFNQAHVESWTKAVKEFPEVATEGSPLRTRATAVYDEVVGELKQHGFVPAPSLKYLVVKHADALLKAEKATTENGVLQKTVTELQAEIKRLTKTTALPGGGAPPGKPATKSIETMSPEELEKDLRGEFGI